jgi:riboflavin kinase/FMN adenylyltransferase
MRIWHGVDAVPRDRTGRAVTIGAFDGVHRGHVALLRLVHDLARARGIAAAVLTFDRHPAEVVRPQSAPRLLTTLEQKLELLDATGNVDECLVLPFDEARSHEPAEEFVEEVLAGVLAARLVVVGADFHFGYRRHGDVPLLQRMGAELGFEVLGLGLVAAPDGTAAAPDALPYSSTRVRAALAAGDLADAAAVLGRPHEVRGELAGGSLAVPNRLCLPTPGRYDGELVVEGVARAVVATVAHDEDAPTRHVALADAPGHGRAALRFLAPR